jgi:Zinc finger, C3HC4 type (RING finger)
MSNVNEYHITDEDLVNPYILTECCETMVRFNDYNQHVEECLNRPRYSMIPLRSSEFQMNPFRNPMMSLESQMNSFRNLNNAINNDGNENHDDTENDNEHDNEDDNEHDNEHDNEERTDEPQSQSTIIETLFRIPLELTPLIQHIPFESNIQLPGQTDNIDPLQTSQPIDGFHSNNQNSLNNIIQQLMDTSNQLLVNAAQSWLTNEQNNQENNELGNTNEPLEEISLSDIPEINNDNHQQQDMETQEGDAEGEAEGEREDREQPNYFTFNSRTTIRFRGSRQPLFSTRMQPMPPMPSPPVLQVPDVGMINMPLTNRMLMTLQRYIPLRTDLNDYDYNLMLANLIGKVERGIENIDTVSKVVTNIDELKEDDLCSICRDNIKDIIQENKIRVLACGHVFCEPCISTWLEKNVKCPICQVELDKINEKNKENQNKQIPQTPQTPQVPHAPEDDTSLFGDDLV